MREENLTIIGALNKYGRVPQTYELLNKIEQLEKENQQLKVQLQTKEDGFKASTEELCEYATILDKFKKWLEKERKRLRKSIKPINEVRVQTIDTIQYKLQELKGSDK